MLHSESLEKIAPAIVKAQAELEHAVKDSTNPHFKSTYADHPAVVRAIKPVYAKHGLSIVQGFVPSGADSVIIETMILHTSGEWIRDEGLDLPLDKRNAQGVGSAVTYGLRYTKLAMTGLAADDDDDGNAASQSSRPRPEAVKSKPAKPAAVKEKVNAEQAAELTAAAIAAGMDPKLAERRAHLTDASKFVTKLAELKKKAGAS